MPWPTDVDIERQPWLLDDVDDLGYLLFRQEGVVSVRQAQRHLSRGAIRSRLARGRWRQAWRGVVVAHNGPLTDGQRLWVASLAAGAGAPALLGGRSALAALGLKGFASDRIDIVAGPGQHPMRRPSHVRVHRTSHLPPQDVHGQGRPPCTVAARSVVDAASWARSDREAMTAVAMAFQQRLVGLDEIRDVLTRLPRAKRRKMTWHTAADSAGGSESLGELDLLRLLRRSGLPQPSRQVARTDARGHKRYRMRSSRSGACTLRLTVPTTLIRRRRGRTRIDRTSCGPRASPSCGFPPGWCALSRSAWRPTSGAP